MEAEKLGHQGVLLHFSLAKTLPSTTKLISHLSQCLVVMSKVALLILK